MFNHQRPSLLEHNQSEIVDSHGETMDQTPIHTNSTSNVNTEDTISLNSYKNYSQSESTLNCSSVKQKYSSEEFFVESYFKGEKILQHFIQDVNLTTAVTLEQERIDQEIQIKYHLNRSLFEHSYCCSSECKRKKQKGRYTKNKRICNNFASVNSSLLANLPRCVVLNANFDENYTLLSESVEVNTIQNEICSEQMSNLSKNSISEKNFREIKQTPSFVCSSCDRILYHDQVHRLKDDFQLTQAYKINAGRIVCSFCHSHIKKK